MTAAWPAAHTSSTLGWPGYLFLTFTCPGHVRRPAKWIFYLPVCNTHSYRLHTTHPTPPRGHAAFRRAMASRQRLLAMIREAVRERRAAAGGEQRGTILDGILAAADEDGEPLSDEAVAVGRGRGHRGWGCQQGLGRVCWRPLPC